MYINVWEVNDFFNVVLLINVFYRILIWMNLIEVVRCYLYYDVFLLLLVICYRSFCYL